MPKPTTNITMLRRLLVQQLAMGRRLVELAEQETEAILVGDVTRLAELEMQQRRCLEQQTALEAERGRASRDVAWGLGLEMVPTLLGLLPSLPPRDRDVLQQLRLQLLETQEQLRILDIRNRRLLDNALEYVRFSLELLTSAALQPAKYGTNLASIAAPTFYLDSKV